MDTTIEENTDAHGVTRKTLWCEGMACAIRNLLRVPNRARYRYALRLLVCPVDFWRYFEFEAVLRAHRGDGPILDLGSPKLLARVLASRLGAEVWATDIVPDVIAECDVYGHGLQRGSIHPAVANAIVLAFEDASFPFVYSVSVLEHIADEGDTKAVREIARVLRPGGTAVITVPYMPRYKELWREDDPYGKQGRDRKGRVFFSRYYDAAALHERLVVSSGLELVRATIWQERTNGWYARYIRRTANPLTPLALLTKALDPYWAATCIEEVRGMPPQVTRHGIITLELHKPNA